MTRSVRSRLLAALVAGGLLSGLTLPAWSAQSEAPVPAPATKQPKKPAASSGQATIRVQPKAGAGTTSAAGSSGTGGAAGTDARPVDPRYNQMMRSAARQASQGQHALAVKTFEQILQLWPDDIDAVRGQADALLALGRLEDAEKLLKGYRQKKGVDPAISRSLATVHRAQEKWDPYLEDVLEALGRPDANGQLPLSWGLRSLEEISGEASMTAKVEPAIRKLIKEEPGHPELRILLADQLLRQGNEAGALAEVVEADRMSKSSGRVLMQYAEELHGAGRMRLAEEAWRKAAAAAPTDEARIEAWGRVADLARTEKRPKAEAEAWQAIVDLAPRSPASLTALESLARVQLYQLNDHAGALATLRSLEASPALGDRKSEIYLPMAECHLRLNQLEEADKALEKLKGSKADQETQAEGAFLSAEIDFYRGSFDEAQVGYQTVAENFTRTQKTNDAVGRYLQIARAKDQEDLPALKVYARMEQFHRMADTTSVLAAADELVADHGASDLACDALVRRAEILRARPGQSEPAIALCERAVAEHPKARAAAYALAVMGDICLKDLGDRKRALAAYERLLDEYPQNLLAAEVRRTVERLRKNSES